MVNDRAIHKFYQAWPAESESVFVAKGGTYCVFPVKKLLRNVSPKNNLFHIGYRQRSHDAIVARVDHKDLESKLFRYSFELAAGMISWHCDLSTHCDIVDSFKGKIKRFRHQEVSLESLMVEKRHHARQEVVLVIVALWNLSKGVLRSCHAAGPNCVLDFIDRGCDQFIDRAGLHEDTEIVCYRYRGEYGFCVVCRDQYFTFNSHHMLSNQREVSSFGNRQVSCARVMRHPCW